MPSLDWDMCSSCIPPAGSLMVTDTCHCHPLCTAATVVRMSPAQVRILPVNVFCTCLSALYPRAQLISHLHTTIMPFCCFLTPARFCSSLLLQHPNGNFPIPIHFHFFSTLNSVTQTYPTVTHLILYSHYFLTFTNLSDAQFRFIYGAKCLLCIHNPKTEKLLKQHAESCLKTVGSDIAVYFPGTKRKESKQGA